MVRGRGCGEEEASPPPRRCRWAKVAGGLMGWVSLDLGSVGLRRRAWATLAVWQISSMRLRVSKSESERARASRSAMSGSRMGSVACRGGLGVAWGGLAVKSFSRWLKRVVDLIRQTTLVRKVLWDEVPADSWALGLRSVEALAPGMLKIMEKTRIVLDSSLCLMLASAHSALVCLRLVSHDLKDLEGGDSSVGMAEWAILILR